MGINLFKRNGTSGLFSNNPDVARLCNWALANTVKQKFDFENAYLSGQTGKQIASVPFGSQITTNNFGGLASVLTGGVVALSIAGLGAWGHSKLSTPQVIPQPPVQVAPDMQPKIIEGVIDYEYDSSSGLKVGDVRNGR